MKRFVVSASLFLLVVLRSFAWTNGELLIWMDAERGRTFQPVAKKFQDQYGIKVTIQSPESLTQSFAPAAQAGKGPDIIMWAHDVVGEWADAGLIAPTDVSPDFRAKFFPKTWEAVTHNGKIWGYPIGMETVALIYNKKLLDQPPPVSLSDLPGIDAKLKKEHPGIMSILWDYKSAYYSWGILASAGAYIFGQNESGYNLNDIGVATSGAVEALTKISALVKSGMLPKSVSYSETEDLMGRGKLAMMISGPWAWVNLTKNGIDFGVSPIPGIDGKPGCPFVGVSAAYLNRSSPNLDIAREFIEQYLVSDEGLTALNEGKSIGIPASSKLYDQVAKENILLEKMKICAEQGQVMPNVPEMGRFWTAVGGALQLATNGQETAQSALNDAAANMRKH